MIERKKIETLIKEYFSYIEKRTTWFEDFEDDETHEIAQVEGFDIDIQIPTYEQKVRMEEIYNYLVDNVKLIPTDALREVEKRLNNQTIFFPFFQEMLNRNDSYAYILLGNKYECGDEKHGYFIDKHKALENYHKAMNLGSEEAEYYIESVVSDLKEYPYGICFDGEDINNVEYTIKGSTSALTAVENLFEAIQKQLNGDNEPTEFGLYLPVDYIIHTLVGSIAYRGNLMEYKQKNNKLVLRVECESHTIDAFKYALMSIVDEGDIDIKEISL